MPEVIWQRRELLFGSMLAMCAAAQAEAGTLDPAETMITLPDRIPWQERKTYPKNSVTSAALFGSRDGSGLYYELIRWYPAT